MHPFVLSTACDVRLRIVAIAELLIESAQYCYLSEDCDPPRSVNCLMLIRYAYVMSGVWSKDPPAVSSRLLSDIRSRGQRVTLPQPADVVSIRQPGRQYEHFGIRGFGDTIIHACWRRGTVVQDLMESFVLESVSPLEAFSFLEEMHTENDPWHNTNTVLQTWETTDISRSVS